MSKVPMPKEIPPTTQQVDRILQTVVVHVQQLIADDPRHFANLRASFLAFYTHPTFQLILGIPFQVSPSTSPPTKQLSAELSELKSTIQALSKTVSNLQPKVTRAQAPTTQPPPPKGNISAQGKGPSPPPPSTYASKAASTRRPSLVLNIGDPTLTNEQLQSALHLQLNNWLHTNGHIEIKLSAAKFTNKGNLVLTAHHATTQSQLDNISPQISQYVAKLLSDINKAPPSPIKARANVKWSKILINSVPVGITKSRGPWTSEENHCSLAAHNPAYSSLTITHQPNWVRSPHTLTKDTQSSLVMAFEDPDGSVRRSLLANKYLYVHGARAKVSRWKETPRPNTNTPTPTNARPPSPATAERRSTAPSEENAGDDAATPPTTLPASRPSTTKYRSTPTPVTRSKSDVRRGPQ